MRAIWSFATNEVAVRFHYREEDKLAAFPELAAFSRALRAWRGLITSGNMISGASGSSGDHDVDRQIGSIKPRQIRVDFG